MLDNESIQAMFSHFEIILNDLKLLGNSYENFDHIDKILHNLPRQWRPQVIVFRTSKSLDGLSFEKHVGILRLEAKKRENYLSKGLVTNKKDV